MIKMLYVLEGCLKPEIIRNDLIGIKYMGISIGLHWHICFMERKEKEFKGAERSKKPSVRSAMRKEEHLTSPLRVTVVT